MGQTIPLPQRIPKPAHDVLEKMNDFGFTINNDGQLFVTYTMPNGWSIKDHTSKSNLPEYYFIDKNNMARILIDGKCDIYYDLLIRNYRYELSIHIIMEPFLYKPIEIEYCEPDISMSNSSISKSCETSTESTASTEKNLDVDEPSAEF